LTKSIIQFIVLVFVSFHLVSCFVLLGEFLTFAECFSKTNYHFLAQRIIRQYRWVPSLGIPHQEYALRLFDRRLTP
jgi:hypothetical protein